MGQEVAAREPKLASEKVVVAAPMSFAGSAQRVWKMTDQANPWVKAVMVVVALAFIAAWWFVIVAWYIVFGILLIPYRLLRRGSRKRKKQALQHKEMLAAIERQKNS